jgi:S-DNA-T family DNA segregation ATPase FtsK/SpoIIIE
MQIRLSVRDADGFNRDVAVSAPAGTSLREFTGGIAAALPRAEGADPALWSGSRPLPATAMLGGPGLRTGDIIDVDHARDRDLAAGAVLRVHLVGGPDAGLVAPLPRGVVTIGRAPGCDVTLTDPDVSRQHAAITTTSAGITVRDLGSTNGTQLDGVQVDADGSAMRPGELVRIGDSLLCVVAADEPVAAVRPGVDGARNVNRPPRLSPSPSAREVVLPIRANPALPQRVQWFASLLPAVAGGALALAMHNIEFLAFALLSPVMMFGTAVGDRLHWRRDRRRAASGFHRRAIEANAKQTELLAAETAHRRRLHPDAAATLRTATIPDCRLWERRRGDVDMLDIRLGLADLPASLRARRGAEVDSAGMLQLVPVTLNLRRGPLGIAGPRGIALGSARWAIAQLAALHSPADLDLVLLLSDEVAPAWTWARWLPHLRERVACTADDRTILTAGLLRLIDERLAERQLNPQGWSGRWTVLVVDRSGALADVPGLARVLAAGPAVGITAVCLDDEERRLPTACAAVARVCGETGTRLAVDDTSGAVSLRDLISDRVSTRWAERVARALAPLTDAGAEAASAIPDSCRLLDLLALTDASPESVIARWQAGAGPVAELGIALEGVFALDLVRDGPHALVAGTTGAGKSELLQSLVASLAASNRPDAMTFVLIDYKGGAAFADCARLPHTVGLVTDLDPHLTQRALQSLDTELHRREALFAKVGAKDLDAYRASQRDDLPTLARLLLVVDEFAALAEELPDFVSGLIGIAQRGRSLGIHLVLATQRPGGVISPEIRANTALRIALRVTDAAESADVIGSDAAAAIDKRQPGRAFVRAGAVLTEIQTARVGGIAPTGSAQVTVTALDEWGRLPDADDSPDGSKTDLQLLVDAVREATARSEVVAQSLPWLPPLPDQLPISAVRAPAIASTIPVGLVDVPAEQQQPPLCVDLAAGGPLMLVGAPRSGRSSVLRSLAVTSARRLGPDDLHTYVIDGSGGGLRPLAELRHCGAVITRDDFGSVQRLLARLTDEIAKRHALLTDLGVGSIAEARAKGAAEPFIMLLVDGWEGFVAASDEHDAGRSVDMLLNLLRECAAVGVTVAITGDRSALAARLAGTVARKFVLRLADRADYALASISARAVPESMPPGRAIRADDGAEVQFGFLGSEPTTGEQWRIATEVACSTPAPGPTSAPFHIRALPSRIARDELGIVRPPLTLLGAGGDAAGAVAVDLFAGDGRLLIAGPPRSGRTTALRLIFEQAVQTETEIWAAAPRRSALAQAAASYGIEFITPDDPATHVPTPGIRPVLLLVDDSEAFLDTPVGDALADVVRAATTPLAAVVSGRSDDLAVTYRGVASEVRRSRSGLLLQPGPGDGDLLGIRLPRTRSVSVPGRGILVLDQPQLRPLADGADVLHLQVALPSPCAGSDDR